MVWLLLRNLSWNLIVVTWWDESSGGRLDLGICCNVSTNNRKVLMVLLTGSVELVALNAGGLLIGSGDQIGHSIHGNVIASVDLNQNTLQGLVLVQRWVDILLSAGSSQSQELRDNEESLLLLLLGSLSLGGRNSLLGLLLVLAGQLLLGASDSSLGACLVLFVELLEVGDLLLVLGECGLKGWLFQDLCLLVGINLAGGNQLIKGLV